MVILSDVNEWVEAASGIAAIGGLGGLAALISSFAAFRTSKGAQESADRAQMTNQAIAAEFRPDHGNSLRDQIDALNRKTDLLAEEVTILARSMDATNSLMRDRLKSHDREIAELKEDCT